jgi:monoamine oxidase
MTETPPRIVILGAGMAGLVAGYELLQLGYQPTILEARPRVGGRVCTLRNLAHGLSAEAGAMRIPRVHRRTLEYCRTFQLPMKRAVTANPRALVCVGDRRLTAEAADREPPWLASPASHEAGRTHDELWREATHDIREQYLREGIAAIEDLTDKYDSFSIRGFLRSQGWSEAAIEQYAVMTFSEPSLNTGVLQEFREMVGQAYEDVQEIAGGMDQLPLAFYQRLNVNIQLGTQVGPLEQGLDSVVIRARTAAQPIRIEADYVICTLPFSVLRNVDATFSAGKRRAIRQLHYDPATKIFFQVRRPFWERDDGIRGGTTVTDLPIRRIVYPSNPASSDERAVLLASYTWGQDALRWSALDEPERTELALSDVARIHPNVVSEFEAAFSYSWSSDRFAMGAYALFEPGQFSSLHADIVAPEGRIYFAGEHCSRWPAWIEGAVESGADSAQAVHLRSASGDGLTSYDRELAAWALR